MRARTRVSDARARQNFVATIASTQLVRAAANGDAEAATWAARMEQARELGAGVRERESERFAVCVSEAEAEVREGDGGGL